MAVSQLIGDSQPVAKEQTVACFAFSTVLVAEITDATSALNAGEGGKQKGAGIIADHGDGTYTLYIADGKEATDKWSPADGGVAVVPA